MKTIEQWLCEKLPIILPSSFDKSKKNLDALAWTIAKSMGILDFYIIPDTKCIITPQGLDDAAFAAAQKRMSYTKEHWDNMDPFFKECWLEETSAAIEAAGIKVVKEILSKFDASDRMFDNSVAVLEE